MMRNCIRTCDLCHRRVDIGQFVRFAAEPDAMELLMVLIANQNRDFELRENPDGTVPLDTCFDCGARVTFEHSHALN
jgi:hypothetical protein